MVIWEMAQFYDISTHAPRTGSDALDLVYCTATINFNPRSPHGERLLAGLDDFALRRISTHAPRTGSDLMEVETWL